MRIDGRDTRYSRGLLLGVALALAVAVLPASQAEEPIGEQVKGTDPAPSSSAEKTDTAEEAKGKVRRKKFRPSERITADSAVAFPVDI